MKELTEEQVQVVSGGLNWVSGIGILYGLANVAYGAYLGYQAGLSSVNTHIYAN